MSQENVEIVRQAYGSPGLFTDERYVAADVEIDFSDVYPDQPVVRNIEEMRAFADAGPWGRSVRLEPQRYVDVDEDRVLVLVRVMATGTGSRVPVEIRVAHEFLLRDGLIAQVKVHRDQSLALKAVGLGGGTQPTECR